MRKAQPGDLAMLTTESGKQFIFPLEAGAEFQSHQGVVSHDDLIGRPWGSEVRTHLGHPLSILEPSLRDILLLIKRRSQIVFPKDIGYVLLRLSAGSGQHILEAGTGSGAMTTALAWSVGPSGKVYSYDRREDMQALAKANLARVGLLDRVEFKLGEVEDGFAHQDVDAIFLDLPAPHLYLRQVRSALKNGGIVGAILPTTNQVGELVKALQDDGFIEIDTCEILLRFYKNVPNRLRPTDRMVAHTGYLVFARPLLKRSAEV